MNEKEFHVFKSMADAFNYINVTAKTQGVLDFCVAVCIEEHIALGDSEYRVPKILPEKACIIHLPASQYSKKAIDTLATSLNQIDGVQVGVSPGGALYVGIYKKMTDTELVIFGMQAGEALQAMKGLEG